MYLLFMYIPPPPWYNIPGEGLIGAYEMDEIAIELAVFRLGEVGNSWYMLTPLQHSPTLSCLSDSWSCSNLILSIKSFCPIKSIPF